MMIRNFIILLLSLNLTACGGSKSNGLEETFFPLLLSSIPPQPEARSTGLSLSSTSLSFGNTYIFGSGSTQTVTVTNSGTFTLTIQSIFAVNDSFSSGTGSLTLEPGATADVTLTFSPTELKSYTSTILFYNNSKEVLNSLTVSGTGSSYATINCGSGNGAIRVRNSSGGTATISMYTDENSCNKDLTNTSGTYVFSSLSDNSTSIYYCFTASSYFIGYIGTSGSGTCTTTSYTFTEGRDYTLTKYTSNFQVDEENKQN